MANVVFFSFTEPDREAVLLIKGRAVNPRYSGLDFNVKDLLRRWDTEDTAVIRQAISKSMFGTSRTLVFVGPHTYLSKWVAEEVDMTIENGKPVYAIRVDGTYGPTPAALSENKVTVHAWSETKLQDLATC